MQWLWKKDSPLLNLMIERRSKKEINLNDLWVTCGTLSAEEFPSGLTLFASRTHVRLVVTSLNLVEADEAKLLISPSMETLFVSFNIVII